MTDRMHVRLARISLVFGLLTLAATSIPLTAAERGPYSLDVTYTLEYVQDEHRAGWQVEAFVYANQPPEWKK